MGRKSIGAVVGFLLIHCGFASAGDTLTFSGYQWEARNEASSGPGPNLWDAHNVWLDGQGCLHLKIARRGGEWSCAEVVLSGNLGFGRYQWEVAGRVDQFAPQIVLGLFNYTLADVGPDGTNEIDIEYSRWGRPGGPPGSFTVWPAVSGLKEQSKPFDFKLDGTFTTSRFDWSPKSIFFEVLGGGDDLSSQIARWQYLPSQPKKHIPQHEIPVHINFWLFEGKPPRNNEEAEVVIKNFTFTPLKSE